MTELPYLLQADFSVSSSGDTYCAVPTKELALATNNANKCLKKDMKSLVQFTRSKRVHPCHNHNPFMEKNKRNEICGNTLFTV